jgi:hypothetical protein
MDRLLGGSALTVDGDSGHRLREASRQSRRPRDVAGLRSDLVQAAKDHIVDRCRVDRVALDEGPDDVGSEIRGMCRGQAAPTPADWCPDRIDYVGLSHPRSP